MLVGNFDMHSREIDSEVDGTVKWLIALSLH